MNILKWCWGLLCKGAKLLFYVYFFAFALIMSVVENVDLEEEK